MSDMGANSANPADAAAPDASSAAGQAVTPGAADTGATSAMATDGAMTAPPAEAMSKTYPVCSRTVKDSCRNPGGK